MLDLIKKTMLTGIGLAMVTKERLDELGSELVEKGQLSEQEGKEFVDEMWKKSEQAQQEFEQQIENTVRSVVNRLNLASKDDLAALNEKLDALREDKS